MKVLLITLLVVAGAFARSAVQQSAINAEGPACPIDDPIRVEQGAINITVDPVLNLEVGSEVVNLIAEGLSTLRYKIDLNIILLTATFEVTIPKVSGNATYSASGYLDARPFRQETVPSGNLTGSGLGKVDATGIKARGSVSIFLNLQGKVQLSRLVLAEVSFDSLAVDLGTTFNIGGGAVDWAELNRNIKANFDRDLSENKNAIQEKLREAANGILKKFTLQDLIDLIGGGDDGGDDGEC
jgi:hypothetical protein